MSYYNDDPNIKLQQWKRSTVVTPPLTMLDCELIIGALSHLATKYNTPSDITNTVEVNLILRLKKMLPSRPNFWGDV